jgi:hypothetical protein
MEGIFALNPLPCKREMIKITSHYLEGMLMIGSYGGIKNVMGSR